MRRSENGAGLEYQIAVAEWGQRQGVVGEGHSNVEPLNYQKMELALMAEVVVDSNPPMELGADYKNKLAYRPLAGGGMERHCVLRKCFAQKEGQHVTDSNAPLENRADYKNKLAYRLLAGSGTERRYVLRKCFAQREGQHLMDSNPPLRHRVDYRNKLAHRALIGVGMGQRYVQQKCFVQKGEQHLVGSNPPLEPEHRNTLAH